MAGDGGDGGAAGEGEAEGHPGLSDTSAAGTAGMAGPAGTGDATGVGGGVPGPTDDPVDLTFNNPNFTQDMMQNPEAVSLDPVSALAMGLAVAKGIARHSDISKTPGVPDAPERGFMGPAPEGTASPLADFGIGLAPDVNEGGGMDPGLLRLAKAVATQPVTNNRSGVLGQQPTPYPQYDFLENYWAGNQFMPAPITRRV